ncbi:putative Ig domain-containing protein [Dyadobacter sp. NIV53]|uniref:putative Ig domain-containing protein n=1 Tax=Dyadobacter sp. NIV53 TaxID=2861765 RepID=UPI001C888135|nr:putative Ig domain-containing protein [Dyadobacter sp. NIV53]
MKKGYSFIQKTLRVIPRVWHLIIVIGLIVSVQSHAFNFGRTISFFTKPIEEFVAHNTAALLSSESKKPIHLEEKNHRPKPGGVFAHAPEVAKSIDNQGATVGVQFTFGVPSGTFTNTGGSDPTLSATLGNDGALPEWLTFNPETHTFEGIPQTAEEYIIKVSASDGETAVSTNFTITVLAAVPVNHAPVATAIPPATATANALFTLEIPSTTFTDEDNDALTYRATQGNGDALPGWLSFNPTSLTFSGTPTAAENYTIKLIANDGTVSVNTEFTLTVSPAAHVNHAPVATTVVNAIATVNSAFTLVIPSTTFTDEDNDALTYSATLGNGDALPGWLSFNPTSRTFSGTPTAAENYTIRLIANDGTVSANTEFTLTVSAPVNHDPVLATAITGKTATVGTVFSLEIPAGTFTDPDGDALTLTATLPNGSALPVWLSFDATSKVLSGTPTAMGTLTVKVTASDSKASVSTEFTLTVSAGCPPNSIFPCNQIAVTLPYILNFTGNEGGLSDKNGRGTGFTMVDPYSGTRASADGTASSSIRGYEPAKLTISPTAGTLAILTTPGINFAAVNNQINALGVGIPTTGVIVMETTVINPVTLTTSTSSEQAGLWFGLNDKTFLKLVVAGGKVELRKEFNDVTLDRGDITNPDQRTTGTITSINSMTVRLRMVADFINNRVEGFYSTDGINYVSTGVTYTNTNNYPGIDISGIGLAGKTVYAGIFATQRNRSTAPTYTFDNYSVKQRDFPLVTAPYRINAGGSTARTVGTSVYSADDLYTIVPGEVSNTEYALATVVPVPQLYYDRRFGTSLKYNIPIANGRYTINLQMVDNFQTKIGFRIFDVDIEGAKALDDLDLIAAGGGPNGTPKVVITRSYTTNVTDGVLNIDFTSSVDKAIINTIEILPAPPENVVPVFANASYTFSKDENAAVGTTIGTVTASDAADQVITYAITAGNEGNKFAINTATGIITLADVLNYTAKNNYSLTVQATDNGTPVKSVTVPVTIQVNQVTPPNHAPVLGTEITAKTVTVNTDFNFTVPSTTFTDADGDVLVLSASLANGEALPAWLSFNSASHIFSGTPTAADTYRIKLTANDGAEAISTEFTLTVDVPVNHEPVVTAITPKIATVNNAFTYAVPASTFTDADGDVLVLSATLANGDALPAWLSFNTTSHTFSGTPTAADDYTIKLTANDGHVSVSTEFTLTVNATPVNHEPVANAITAKTATVNSAFTFAVPAETFTDADGDVLTLSATQANGDALPAWLSFNAANSTFSGTPSATAGYTIKLIAYDGHVSVSSDFTLTVNAPVATNCEPTSSLPCNQINVTIPFSLTFSGTEGGLIDNAGKSTGFTMADAYSGTRVSNDGLASSVIRGYEPNYLAVTNSRLNIRAHKGISILTNNNQINSLGVGFAASAAPFVVETTIINPVKAANDEQGGIWYGLNDKTFLRLSVNNNKVILRKETDDVSPVIADLVDVNRRITNTITGLQNQTVRLRLVIDPVANTAEAFYSTDGISYINVGEAYSVKTLNIAGMGITGTQVYAGVFGTQRNGTGTVTFAFDNFSVGPYITTPLNHAPVVATVVTDINTPVGSAFSFIVPGATFTDEDGDALTLSATLTDGNALPAWLTFNTATNTFSGTPSAAKIYPIKLTATDGQEFANTEFAITVQAVNRTPVVVTFPENQTYTAGQIFSFLTGSFSDPDAGDVLTYTTTQANGTALPTWLQFNATNQTFSGTAPAEAGNVPVRVTAIDRALASVSATFMVTIQPAPVVIPCLPISTLPCEEISVTLPFLLNFDGQEGGLIDKNRVATGFTMVDAYTGTRLSADGAATSEVIGYEPSRLTVTDGLLNILTSKGIAFSTAPANNQINSLGVGIPSSGKLIFETTIVRPLNGTSSQQGGLWVGLNDRTFVKLVVTGNTVELRKELNDASSIALPATNPDQRVTAVIAGLNNQTVRLRMVLNLFTNKLEGFYSTDGVTYLNTGATYTSASNPSAIDITDMALAGKALYGGIFATHRNAGTAVTYSFDNFSITQDATAGKVLAFSPNALDFSAIQGQAVTAKSTVLSSSEGSPVVTFTSTSASWLTLPAARLGNVAFGPANFSSTLAPGIHEATVTATAEGYQPATLLINLTISSPALAQEIKVNFQDPVTVPPTGWVKDYGQPFGLKTGTNQGTNLEYGWRKRSDATLLDLSVGGTIPGNGRKRTTPADLLLATFMHMQADDIAGTFNGTKTEGYWEVKVPNGSYDVTVSAGDSDPGTVPEIHTINVEGVNAISNFVPTGTAGTTARFRSGKVRVTVADGFLTINADGGTNTKINSALITPVDMVPYLVWSASEHNLVIEKGTTEANKTFSLDLNHSTTQASLPVSLTAVYGEGAANWLSFDATHNGDEPNVTFDYTAAKGLAEGTYTVTITASSAGYTSAGTLIHITVLAPGANQPYVVSSTPANGATNVSVNISSIAANNLIVPEVSGFKGGVDNSTLTVNTVKVLKVVGTATTEIQGIVQGTGGGDAISFSPVFALEANTKYRFVITNQVKSYSGAAFLPYEATFTTGSTTTGTPNPVTAEFAPKQVIPGTVGKKYTSLTFGPDGKFYALRLDGVIERFNVDRETGMLSSVFEIKSITAKYGSRSSVGLTFDPASTATNLIAWISHCSAGLSNAPEFDGNISKLTGADLETEQQILTKLPRSKADHLVNSIAFGPDGALYFNQGSNSSMGVYDGAWQRDESLLAATVMRLDMSKLAGITLPLDVRTTANQALINAAPADNMRMSDGTYNPYASTSPLTIYASGVRNAFDLLWHSNGQLYVPANGSAAGGNSPASVVGTRRPDGTPYNGPVVIGTTAVKVQNDWLFRVNPLKPVGYYGHPNPLRGQYVANRGYLDNPKYPATQGPDANYRPAAFNFELNKSPNGVIEYKSNAFGGSLKGRILVCRFSGGSDIIVLEPGAMAKDASINSAESDDKVYDIIGSQTGSGTNGISGLSGFTNPLDITEDVETGNLYVIEYNWNNISGKTAQIVLLKATAPSAQVGIAAVSPAEIVENDVIGGAAGKTHTITVANTGNSNLTVTGITLDGTDKNQFQLTGAPNPSVASPVTIARGSAITFNIAFNPTTAGVKTASILVTSTNNEVKTVSLSGLGTAGLSGTNEPSLQAVLDVHGIIVNVGDDNKNTNIIHSTNYTAPILGEEVSIQKFQRGEDGPVIIEPLSVFGPTDPAGIVTGFGWYSSGLPNAKNELFTVDNSQFQTVNVQPNGTLTFDPAYESFGFYSRWPYFNNRHLYSEDALNTFTGAVPHHVRVYPLKNSEGAVIENAYIIATEEHISGWDYQDIVVIVRNVKPFETAVAKDLALSATSLDFAHTLGTITTPKTVTLTASTGSPSVTITKSGNSPWLTLPAGALGTLSFGINGDGLAAGTYSTTVTISASGYTSVTLPVTLTVTNLITGATIAVSSDELVFDALKNTVATKRITITNTSKTTLNLGAMSITGTNAAKFDVQAVIAEGVVAGPSLAPDETKNFQISFTPGNEVNTFNATLVINSDAGNSPVTNVNLYAISLNGYEGDNEPPLQTVVNVLGYGINVGWTNLAGGIQTTMKGEEVPVQLFEKNGNGPVTITPVARYSPNQELPFGFYTKTNNAPVRSIVGTLSGVLGQHNVLYPQIVAGTDQFNPESAAFGIYVVGIANRLSYTEDQLNAGGPALHAVRTYPLRNRQGELVPNSYLVCFEDASNGDYQDYMFVLKNVIAAGTRKELAFNAATLDFNAPVNGTVAAKSITLEAKNGTPAAITFTKVNAGWLTLPNPAIGDLSFGINTAGLTAGTYTTTVTAAASEFASSTITVNLRVTDVNANSTKVNFQLATAATPAGYVADAGLPYNDTRTYGWIDPTTKEPKDNSANMRDRAVTTAELRLRGLALMQGTSAASWEIKVNPGQYNVTIGAGDLSFYDSKHRINVEGVNVINDFVPTAAIPSQISTTTVQVNDGKLTIDATGGTNSKINFVIVEAATAEGDFIAPVASIQLKGTLQSAGVYKNQVIATVNATDLGGSGLAQVLYSLNNAAYAPYYSPLLLSTPGVYTLRAKATDGNGNETITGQSSFTVVQPAPSNANMVVENLDKFPGNDRLVFSLIQTPWRRTNDDGTFTAYNRNHDVVKVKISNKGTGVLNVGSLNLSNTAAWKIATINNVVYDPATAAPITLNSNGSVEVGIQFIANFTSGRVRILTDTLNIISNDDQAPKKSLMLNGLWQARGEGNNEPYAREIISAFGFKTNVGFVHDDGTNAGSSMILNTDEIMSSFFTRADATKPVSVVQMAAYHGCCAATETFQYYAKGATGVTNVFTHNPLDGQSLLPQKNGTAAVLAEGTFTPSGTGIFGFKSASSYSDRTRNSEGKIGLRVWKAVNADGDIIPNAYLVGHDYIGNPLVTNYDYQDNVFYVSNIKPETGALNYSELSATTSSVEFAARQVGATDTRTIDLKNLGLIYDNGITDPSITIKSVEITGANQNEFSVAAPASMTLAPQGTTTVNVTFRPNTQGIKNAALMINYNNSLSPLRIPLYGIADNSCNVIAVVKRIKGGADANVTINGKVWETDKAYRQGSVQLDKPAATPIAGTDDDVLYQTYLSAAADLGETRYQVPLANGNYMVRMHFVENFFTAVGSRVFTINMENQTSLANFDIFRENGYKTAMVKDFQVAVADGILDIKFNPTVNRLALAGMEIFAATPSPNAIALTQLAVTGSDCGATNGSIVFGVTNSSAASFLYKIGAGGTYQSSPVFENLAAGNYTFYVKENIAGGCETAKVFTIPQNNNLAFAVSAPVIACSATTGTATVSNITGGSGNYTITWATAPVQTGATATGLAPGTYSVTILDVTGCSKTQQVTVTKETNCATAIRINSGGALFTASGSRVFTADTYFGGTNGTGTLATTVDILNTTDDVLYRSERSSAAFNYSIPVPNGSFNVILHFAETYFGAPGKVAGAVGKRKFHVNIEGNRKLTDYDIYDKAGGAVRPVLETFPVTVTDGMLNIDFLSGSVNLPKISAIEVIPTAPIVNAAPVLAAIGSKTVTVGQALTFTATATDSNADQTKVYSLVGAPAGAVINATTGVFTWTPATAGTFTFTVRVTDNGLPVMTDDEQITVTVNNIVNEAPVLAAIGNKTVTLGQALTFTATATDVNTNQTKTFSLIDAPAGAVINATTGAFAWTPAAAGTFTFTIRVTDDGIPVLTDDEQITVIVNNVVNEAPVLAVIGNKTVTLGQALTFTATATDVNTNQTKTFSLIDAPAGAVINATTGAFAWTPAAAGTFTFTLRVTDNGIPVLTDDEQIAVTVNNIVNEAPVLAAIGNKTVTLGQALTFTATATDANTAQTKTYSLVNAPADAAINATTGVFTWTPTAASTFTFTIRVTDNGIPVLTDDEQITVTVNTVAPAAIRINSGGALFNASDSRTFIADTYFGGTNGTGTLATTVDILNTTDDVLYRSERSSAAFNYSIPVTNGSFNVILHFAETYFGAPGKPAGAIGKRKFHVNIEGTRKLDDYDIYAKAGGAVRPVLETFPVTVTDGILNIDFLSGSVNLPKISAIEVVPTAPIVNAAPVLAVIGDKTATVGQALTFTATATDANTGQTKTYSLVSAPAGAAINATTGVFTWTPTAAGTVNFSVRVTDNGSPALSDEKPVTVTVSNTTNAAPVLAVIGDKAVTVGQALTFTATATDANTNQTKTYSLVSAPAGAAINATTGVFTWTPTAAGTVNFSVRVTDNGSPALSDEKPVTVTVSNTTNAAPVLALIGNKTATVGQALTFTATATDANTNQTKTYSLVSAPAGAAINATTGIFNWTPTAAGTFTFTVRVTDNGTPVLTDDEQITVTVSAVAPAAIRINAGGAAFTASGNRAFIADRYFGGTNATGTLASTVDILNTTDDVLYRSERSSAAFNYSIPVTNGSFNVILHFAETYFGAPGKPAGAIGKRKFHVNIEGTRKLDDYDIYAKAGGAVRPVLETFPVTVTDGILNIDFLTGSVNLPKISAIEVIPAPAPGARVAQENVAEVSKAEFVKSGIYPNPVQKRFTVELSGQHTGNIKIQLVSAAGRIYNLKLPENKKGGSKADLDISNQHLSAGTYLLRIQSAAASEIIRVLVVD